MSDIQKLAAQATDLSGNNDVPKALDLSKPVTEQDFRKAMLSLTNNLVAGSEQTIYHLERALPLLVQMCDKIANEITALNARLDGLEILDAPEGEATEGEQEQDAPAGEAAQEAQDTTSGD